MVLLVERESKDSIGAGLASNDGGAGDIGESTKPGASSDAVAYLAQCEDGGADSTGNAFWASGPFGVLPFLTIPAMADNAKARPTPPMPAAIAGSKRSQSIINATVTSPAPNSSAKISVSHGVGPL
jgi:hypothetical protein